MSWEKNGMKRSLSLGANNFEIHAEFVQNIHFVCVCEPMEDHSYAWISHCFVPQINLAANFVFHELDEVSHS